MQHVHGSLAIALILTGKQEKDKQRRLRQREEKLEAQRKHQEERVKRALERAQAEAKKMVCCELA